MGKGGPANKKPGTDWGLEKLQSVIYHLEVHVLTEAQKRLEVLSSLSRSIVGAKLVPEGSYKIEFQLEGMQFNETRLDLAPVPSLSFSSDAARVKVKEGVVYYGVKSSQSAMFKQRNPKIPARSLFFFQHDVETSWHGAAKDILAKLLDDTSLNAQQRSLLLKLRQDMLEWEGKDRWTREVFLPEFVLDNAQVEKLIKKLNGIIDQIWDAKADAWKAMRKQDSLVMGIRPPSWPITHPDLLFPGFEQSGSLKQVRAFTSGYLTMLLKHHYSGALGQTNYEGLHQAAIWLEKVMSEDRNSKRAPRYLALIETIQLIEAEIRNYEKKVRCIPCALDRMSDGQDKKPIEHAFRFLCELQECRFRAYVLLTEACKSVIALSKPELENVLVVFDKMAIRIAATDPESVKHLAAEFAKAPNPRADPGFPAALEKYAYDLAEFSQKTQAARDQISKALSSKKKSLKSSVAALEKEFLTVVEKELAPVSPIHAQIFIDEVERIKAHSNFKQGTMIESDANACLAPEKILQTAACLMANGRLDTVVSKKSPGTSALSYLDSARAKLGEIIRVNGAIADDLAALGVGRAHALEKAKPFGHIEHNFEDIFPNYKNLLEHNSTHTNVVVKYSESVRNEQDDDKPHTVRIDLKSVSGMAVQCPSVELMPGSIKEFLGLQVASSQRPQFEDIVLGMPYDTKQIESDFGKRSNDYLTHAMPYHETIMDLDSLKTEFESGGPAKRIVAAVNDESALNGAVLEIDGLVAENPAKLLNRPNTAKQELESKADRGIRADIEKYLILKKLIPLRNKVDVVHRKSHEVIYLSLKDFQHKMSIPRK
ncbi:MAG: hypothetical protein WC506_04950 [Candidatus Micrarchaeia archaeon]